MYCSRLFIKPRAFLLFLIVVSVSCGVKTTNEEVTDKKRPNIVLILSDDQSWTDYSFLNHEAIQSPRIDKLANEALTFTRGYTTAPLCRPALASIVTGLYPYQHGVLGNDVDFNFKGSKANRSEWLAERAKYDEPIQAGIEDLETLADLLGEVGYASLQTGKWWEGNFSRGGFDEGMTHGDPKKGGRHGDVGLKIGRKGMDVLYDFIDSTSNEEKPFFIWYAPFLPHNPHNPPDSLIQKYLSIAPSVAEANYWATCEWFDITCGQLVDYVDNKGLAENTLFVYVTDNGWIQDPNRPNRYAPRSKREPYEMGIRTPIFFRWKGNIEPKMDTLTAVSSIDIATTILGICDIEPTSKMQGVNVLNTEVLNARGAIFAETYAHDFSTIDSSLYYRVVIDMPWKLILPDANNKSDKEPELYNVIIDPHEENNLAKDQLDKVEELTNVVNNWWLK